MTETSMLYLDILDEDDTIYVKLESTLTEREPAEQAKAELVSTLRSFGETDIIESSYFEL